MKRYIKFMTGGRSIQKLEKELNKIGLPIAEIDCGIVKFHEKLNQDQSHELTLRMPELGFEVLDPVSSDLLDQATAIIRELIFKYPEIEISTYPAYLELELHCDEFEINSLFSQVYGISVCQCAHIYQVERIKEMILYEDLSLNEVVEILHLKDKAFVNQIFKDITGLPTSYYEKVSKERKRIKEGKKSFEPITKSICIKGINVAN